MAECGEQGDVLRGEHPLLAHRSDQRAQEPVACDQRYPEHRDDAFRRDRPVDVGVVHDLGGREVVADAVGRPGSRDAPGDADIRGRVEVHAEVRADAPGRGPDPQPGAVLLEDRQVGEVGVDQVVGAADDALQRLVDPSQRGEARRGVEDRDLLLPPPAAFGQLAHPDDSEVVRPSVVRTRHVLVLESEQLLFQGRRRRVREHAQDARHATGVATRRLTGGSPHRTAVVRR